MPKLLDRIDRFRKEGGSASFDVYPYTGAHTSLRACIPKELRTGPLDKKAIIALQESTQVIEQKGLHNICKNKWHDVILTSCTIPSYSGKTIAELSVGRTGTATILAILEEDINAKAILDNCMSQDDILFALRQPDAIVGSDGYLFDTKDRIPCHPRSYGTFARAIRFGQEKGIPFEKVIRQMTSNTAERFLLQKRGSIKQGFAADIVILSDATKDQATNDHPHASATGIHTTIVNGKICFAKGKITGIKPGKILRRTP
jgi:N-acyl-D-amino-acid deacylase